MATHPFEFIKTDIEGAFLVSPFYMEDSRGTFTKNYEREIYRQAGFTREIAEEFETYSVHNVVRGLHFQTRYPQDKIVRCVNGEIYDVIVDLRRDSKTFAQWRGFSLSENTRQSLLIPNGCAHGFLTLSSHALVSYICAGTYYKEYDTGILWKDPTLGIEWPVDPSCEVVISAKDENLQSYEHFIAEFGGF